jgi:hypothetical protein
MIVLEGLGPGMVLCMNCLWALQHPAATLKALDTTTHTTKATAGNTNEEMKSIIVELNLQGLLSCKKRCKKKSLCLP